MKSFIIFFCLFFTTNNYTMETGNNIFELIYFYYPKNIEGYLPQYENTKENKRLQNILNNPPNVERVESLINAIVHDSIFFNIRNMTLLHWGFPCYHLRFIVKNKKKNDYLEEYVLLISLIGDFYYIFKSPNIFSTETRDEIFKNIESKMSKYFRKYKLLDDKTVSTVIPDLSFNHFDYGEVKVLHCLFTPHLY